MNSHSRSCLALLALMVLVMPLNGHAKTACENLFDPQGTRFELIRLLVRKQTLLFSLKATPDQLLEAMLYENPDASKGTLLLFFHGKDKPENVAIADIKLDSLKAFDSKTELLKYRMTLIKPGQHLEFSSYPSEEEILIGHVLKKIEHGQEYIGDSLPVWLRPKPEPIKRTGTFVKEAVLFSRKYQADVEGFILAVNVHDSATVNVFIPYHLMVSSSLKFVP